MVCFSMASRCLVWLMALVHSFFSTGSFMPVPCQSWECLWSVVWPKYVTGTQKGQDSIFPHESYLWGKRESPALDFNNQDQGYEQTLKRQHLKSYHVCCCRVFQATVWLKQFWNQDIPVVQTDLIFFTKQIQIQILCNSEHYVRTLLGMGRKRGRSIRLTQEWKTSLAIRT